MKFYGPHNKWLNASEHLNLPASWHLDQSQEIQISHRLLAKPNRYHLIHYNFGPPISQIAKMAAELILIHHAPFNRFLQCWFNPYLKISPYVHITRGQLLPYILSPTLLGHTKHTTPLTIVLYYNFSKLNGYAIFYRFKTPVTVKLTAEAPCH